MHRRSQRLPPARSDVALVQPRQRLAAAEHVEERAHDAGVGREQHKSPFEHRRFRRGPNIHRYEQQRRRRQQEPQQHHPVQHRDLLRSKGLPQCSVPERIIEQDSPPIGRETAPITRTQSGGNAIYLHE
jgi:hypothetical protein